MPNLDYAVVGAQYVKLAWKIRIRCSIISEGSAIKPINKIVNISTIFPIELRLVDVSEQHKKS